MLSKEGMAEINTKDRTEPEAFPRCMLTTLKPVHQATCLLRPLTLTIRLSYPDVKLTILYSLFETTSYRRPPFAVRFSDFLNQFHCIFYYMYFVKFGLFIFCQCVNSIYTFLEVINMCISFVFFLNIVLIEYCYRCHSL